MINYPCDRCGTMQHIDPDQPPDTSRDGIKRSYRPNNTSALRARHAVVAALRKYGWTQRQIAKALKMSQRNVFNDAN